MAVTADTPVANTASDNEVDKVVSPPAPPPKMSLQGNPWPGFLHLYSRLLVSTLSRVNNHLRTDLTTSSPDELRRKPSPEEPRTSQTLEESRVGEIPERPAAIETSTEDPFTSTTTNEKEISFMPLHTTPKPVIHESSSDEERRPTFEDTNSEVDTFPSDYHEDISESGEVEDSIPLRKTVEFTPSPAEVDRYHSLKDDYEEEDEEEQEDTDNPGIRLPPWERLRGRHNFRSKFEEFRSRDASKEWGRYKKFGGNGKNKGLTLMQIFVHKGEPRHPAILYPMMYRRPQMYHSSWPSSHHFASPGPRFVNLLWTIRKMIIQRIIWLSWRENTKENILMLTINCLWITGQIQNTVVRAVGKTPKENIYSGAFKDNFLMILLSTITYS